MPGHLVFLLGLAAVLVGLHWLLGQGLWVCLAVLALGAFGLVGDLINIVRLGRRSALAERPRLDG